MNKRIKQVALEILNLDNLKKQSDGTYEITNQNYDNAFCLGEKDWEKLVDLIQRFPEGQGLIIHRSHIVIYKVPKILPSKIIRMRIARLRKLISKE